ncbi:MAG: DUF4405 domain-containing protein [Gemmatimonadetes bacterium]|nr:DUF4405 domain-containing protein [Gemmatimonadota bacterium]NNM06919.1 DUF4405 domain-containing protein [Gemmatimonadota bacterium]
MKIRRVISLSVLFSFIILALSGVMLFLSPQGRVAYWAGWTLLGLSKEQYSAIHTTLMMLFLAASIWHIVLNWRPIVGYLKDRSKKIRVFTPESSLAMGLVLAFVVGPLVGLPPFKQFLEAGEDIKGYWEATRGSPPWGHAEESRLDAFCRRIVDFQRWEGEGAVVVDCDAAVVRLRDAGFGVEDQTQTIIEIARANGTTPQAIADIVLAAARPATADEIAAGLSGARGRGREGPKEGDEGIASGSPGDRFQRPLSGLGRLTLRDYAEQLGYELEELLAILAGKGMEVDPDERLREAATELGLEPSGIIDSLNSGG